MKVGEIIPADREIVLNEGKKTTKILVANKGDRPVQVGSHFHFFEVNKCLSFDREAAYGYHLDIPSGTSVRFDRDGRQKTRIWSERPDKSKSSRGHQEGFHGKGSIKGILIRRDTNERKNFR